jgi:hypothetical protein
MFEVSNKYAMTSLMVKSVIKGWWECGDVAPETEKQKKKAVTPHAGVANHAYREIQLGFVSKLKIFLICDPWALHTEMGDFAYKSMPRLCAQLCVVVNEFCMHLCVGFCMQSQYVICMQILYGG